MTESAINFGDYLRFMDMDKEGIKESFVEWLYRLARNNDWLDDEGNLIQVRVAEYFKVSRQVVSNWLNGTSLLSSQMVAETICPRLGYLPSQFWAEMQEIDAQRRGLVTLQADTYQAMLEGQRLASPADLMSAIDKLTEEQKAEFKRMFLLQLAKES